MAGRSLLRVNPQSATKVVATALLIAVPLHPVFGALSDRVGRKKIMMAGCLLAAVSYFPIYRAMASAAGNHVMTVKSQKNPVTGEIRLTPLTRDASGALAPVSEADVPNIPGLIPALSVNSGANHRATGRQSSQ